MRYVNKHGMIRDYREILWQLEDAEKRPTDNDPKGRHNTEFPHPIGTDPYPRVPMPTPRSKPPAPYWRTVQSDDGREAFYALVVPLPIPYVRGGLREAARLPLEPPDIPPDVFPEVVEKLREMLGDWEPD